MRLGSAFLSALAVAVFFFAWKLSQGPIELPQLSPYISQAVAQNGQGLTLRLEKTTVSWQGWTRILDLRIHNASLFSKDGRRFAHIPEAAISLSGNALVQGVIAPQSIEVFEPTIQVLRHGDGTFSLDFGSDNAEKPSVTLAPEKPFDLVQLLGYRPTLERPLSFLQRVDIVQAHFDYEDRVHDLNLQADDVSVALERIGETLLLESSLDFDLEGARVAGAFAADYNITTQVLESQIDLAALPIAPLAKLFAPEAIAPLQGVDLSVQGNLHIMADRSGKLRQFKADLQTGDGVVVLSKPFSQALAVEKTAFNLSYNELHDKIRLEKAEVALKKGSLLKLPDPLSHDFPVESVNFTGSYDVVATDYSLDDFILRTGAGMSVALDAQGKILDEQGQRSLSLQGKLLDVDIGLFDLYWPSGVIPNAREWVVNHIVAGFVPQATIQLDLSADEQFDALSLDHLSGQIDIARADVDYLPPLAAVLGTKGVARYNAETFNIEVEGGKAGAVQVEKGSIAISGLSAEDQYLDLDLNLSGSLPDQLRFIDTEPLGFAAALGIDPEVTAGAVDTNVAMHFPLINHLGWDQVDITATAKGQDVVIEQAALGQDVRDGQVELTVTQAGLDLSGDVTLGRIPATLTWRENFNEQSVFKRRFRIQADQVTQDQRVKELQLDFTPFNDEIFTGPIPLQATIVEEWSGQGAVEVFADLKDSALTIPVVNWQKPTGQAGQAYAKVTFNEDRLIGVPYFTVNSEGLEAIGSIGLDPSGQRLQVIELDKFHAGMTQIDDGTVLYSPTIGWEVDVTGKTLDLMPALASMRESRKNAKPVQSAEVAADTGLHGTFSGRFNSVFLDEDYPLQDVVGALVSNGVLWSQIHMTGEVGNKAPFSIDISPDGNNRRLEMTADDAGGLLRALDLFDDMQGGALEVTGVLNDQSAHRPLVGRIQVDDYRIVEVPSLAKVLSLAALTGIVDSLRGDGIGFSRLDAPFKAQQGIIEFKDGLTSGLALGVTWRGLLDTEKNTADISGTIVPAYGVNSFLGSVPVIGNLFTSGERGGGLFAWTYEIRGDLDDPKVSVNGVSALAPGLLRRLFSRDPAAEQKNSPP